MKRLLSLAIAILTVVGGWAYERTDNECISAAMGVLQRNVSPTMKSRLAAAKPQKLMERSQLSLWGYEDAGFAVIAHDTSVPVILGYSDGPVAMDDMSPSLKHYLETLNGYIDYCLENGIEFKNVFYNRQNTSVGPLVKTKWDQGEPYYNMTPTYKGQHCLTGCVATSAAQVLNYLQLPKKPCHGFTFFYTTIEKDQRTLVSCDFSKFQFDWPNMRNTYNLLANAQQRKAVAELMFACGVAACMGYGTSSSGAYPPTMTQGLNDFFPEIKATFYGSMVPDVVYEELDNGRPLCYSGANENGGHSFVIDGYDSQGQVHCNMGWSGGGDGYYTVTDMNGYPSAQDLIQIVPDDSPRPVLEPCANIPELDDMTVTCDYSHPATEIEEGKWYFLHSVGRSCHTCSQGVKEKLMGSNYIPINEPIEYARPHLVRFVPSALGGVFIQTGLGDYFGTLSRGDNNGTTKNKSRKYTYGKIADADGYFWFRDSGGTMMDSNGAGASIAGWGSEITTDTTSNQSWKIFPAILTPPIVDTKKQYYIQQVASGLYLSMAGTGEDENGYPAPVILSKEKSLMTIKQNDTGWTVTDEEGRTLGLGEKSWTLAVDNAATWTFTETGTDGVFRINCTSGYLATDDTTEGSPLWRDKTRDNSNGLWRLVEGVPSGINKVTTTQKAESVRINPFIVVEDGKKILKP